MSLVATGECQVLLQTYKYKNLRFICTFKIYPNVYNINNQKQIDYHWMTASRWSRIEHGLRRHFDGTRNLSINADKLQAEMQIDHIKMVVNPTSNKCLTAIKTVFHAEEVLDKEELVGLEIVLKYISHEDIISKGSPAKRHHLPEKESTELGQSKPKQRITNLGAATGTEPSSSTPRINVKIKRERRSISQSDHKRELTQKTSSAKNGHVSRKDKPDKTSNSRASSVESVKPTRRSARSPVQPQRFQNFVLGQTTSSKTITQKKPSVMIATRTYKFEQLDGSALGALQQIDNMLNSAMPREVKILLLENKSQSEILDTFEIYQSNFQRFFERQQHKLHTVNYLGICHLDIMDILSTSIQTSMIQKLGDIYSKKSSHGSLVINGLLPMWIIRLLMDEYKFQREEDVATHIKEQLKYTSYLKALNNDPLASDLDD